MLYSSAVAAKNNLYSNICFSSCKQDNKTIAVKYKVSKRSYKKLVYNAIKKNSTNANTLYKKVCQVLLAYFNLYQLTLFQAKGKIVFNTFAKINCKKRELVVKINTLEKEKVTASKNKKGAITKQINKLQQKYNTLSSFQSF